MEADNVEKSLVEERNIRVRVEEELTKNSKTHEDEVSLRLKFEEKLNNLHALNRVT